MENDFLNIKKIIKIGQKIKKKYKSKLFLNKLISLNIL